MYWLNYATAGLHNCRGTGQIAAMEQDDKDKPPFGGKTFAEAMQEEQPPPMIETVATPSPEEAEAQARALREAYLWDIEEQSKKLQPSFVNRAYVKMEGRVLRISFGEHVGDEDIYRSAIVMTPEDAFELGQLLTQQAGSAYGMLLDHYRQALEELAPKEETNG